jgi:hypothetical protein
MSGASWWIFMKLRKCGKCIDSINSPIKSSLKKEKMMQIAAVFRKIFLSTRFKEIPSGLLREEQSNKRLKSNNYFFFSKTKLRF